MNDQRFIELLNLYVDQQIGPSEATELEEAVLRDPARRRVYDQYCRLQRGCCMLGDHSRSTAPAAQRFVWSLREVERKISAPRRPVWRSVYFGSFASAAMAACVVVVVVVNRSGSVLDTGAIIADVGQPEQIETVAPARAVAVVAPSPFESKPMLTAASFGVVRNAREAEIAATDREALEWMKRVDALPVTSRVIADDQLFESRPTLQQDNRVFRSRHALQGNAEFAAFQFQR
ncbi:MAG: hypothetical protein WC205_20080 [Opitutaceae bacterium]